MSSTKYIQMVALGYKMAPPMRVLGSNHKNRLKIFKNFLLQDHFHQMLEIRFVALPSSPLPSVFEPRSMGSKWPYALGNMENSSVSEPLGSDA